MSKIAQLKPILSMYDLQLNILSFKRENGTAARYICWLSSCRPLIYIMYEGNISDPEKAYGYICMVAGQHFSSLIGQQAQILI